MAPRYFNDSGPGASSPDVPSSWTAVAVKPQARDTGSTRGGSDPPGAGPDSTGNTETAKASTGAVPAAAPDSGNSSRGTAVAAAAAAAARPNLLSALLIDYQVISPGVRVEPPGLMAVRPSARDVGEGGGIGAVAEGLSGHPQLSAPRVASVPATAPDGEPAEGRPELSAPPVPGVLATLPPFDLSALERGMHLFLDRLGWVGQELVGRGDGTGLGPWIVAGAAAVVACEIARRQFQRPEARGQRSERNAFF
jgi:hypothetical protein